MASLTRPSSGVNATSFSTKTQDGEAEIELRWYAKSHAPAGAAIIYTHGGRMLAGIFDLYDELVCWYVAESGVPFLTVELRLAPEATNPPGLAEDVFSGPSWLVEHANDLGADPARVAAMGDRVGGCAELRRRPTSCDGPDPGPPPTSDPI